VIRVLLVDDHSSFRQALAFMLERESDMTVVGQAASLSEARGRLRNVDIAVVDLDLPDGSGVELIRELRYIDSHTVVLVLTASTKREELAQAVEAGAAGVLHKSSRVTDIVDGLRRLSSGESLLSHTEMLELLRLATHRREEDRDAQFALSKLTPREREVLGSLAEGLTDKDIAERLSVSTQTVRTHMVNILNKLGVNSRLQALVFAIRHGAVTVE